VTITPLSPQVGTLQQWEPPPRIPDHIAAGDEAVFIAQALEWRKRHLAGKETQNDRQLVEGWLGDCTPTSSVETVKTYRRHIERLRLFLRQWNEAPLREQPDERFLAPGDPEAIDAFAGSLRHLVHATDEQGNPRPLMSVSTYNVIVAAISSFYKWCSQPNRRGFTGVPLSPVPSGLQLKKAARKAKALSHEQLHQVYFGARQCRTSPSRSRDELIVRLLYLLGTRATETANLRWDDLVQLETGPAIHVRAETAKGKKERFIALGQPAMDVLAALRLVQPASPWILPNLRRPDRHVSRQGLWKLCRRAGDQVGVKFWTHCARHTHATHAYAITKDPKLIQNTLGHSDVSTTLSLYVDETAGDSSSKYLE
jgi:integrase